MAALETIAYKRTAFDDVSSGAQGTASVPVSQTWSTTILLVCTCWHATMSQPLHENIDVPDPTSNTGTFLFLVTLSSSF
jgi:hypothetical protein